MSPSPTSSRTAWTSFPRVSGDEPREIEALLDPEQFSPRERG